MVRVQQILDAIPHVNYIGNRNINVSHPVQANPSDISDSTITWVSDKNITLVNKLNKGIVICSQKVTDFVDTCSYLITENPRLAFQQLITLFFDEKTKPYVSPLSSIHSSVKMGNEITIEPFVVIEEGSSIGNNTVIGANTVIKRNTQIGNNVKIGSNNTIGGVGFGYEKDQEGNYALMPHLGNVILKDYVEIGNNTCIDRAVLGSTTLHEHVKVDNQVHIAHGVQIGANSLIIANAMIGGSTIIGKNVWFAPSASVLNKKSISDNAVIGMAAVVVKNVNEGEVIVGNPGKPLVK